MVLQTHNNSNVIQYCNSVQINIDLPGRALWLMTVGVRFSGKVLLAVYFCASTAFAFGFL